MLHNKLTGEAAVHQSAYVQTNDPGPVGAFKDWYDTSTTPAAHKVRNAANDGWAEVGSAKLDILALEPPEVPVSGAAVLGASAIGKMHVCSGDSDYALTLPAASGNAGKAIAFRVAWGARAFVTLAGSGAETIHGQAARILWAGEVAILLSDGAGWFKVAGATRPMSATLSLGAVETDNAQSVGSDQTNPFVTVRLDTVVKDPTGRMADAANNRVIVRRPGAYEVNPQIAWRALPTNVARLITKVRKNGADLFHLEASALQNAYPTIGKSAEHDLAAGDFVTLHPYHASGVTQNLYGGPGFTYVTVSEKPSW